MGWGTLDMFVAPLDDEQVSILYARDESHLLGAQFLIEVTDEPLSVFGVE